MNPCIVCATKHIASAEIFVHEAMAGYPTHIVKAFGQLDHAEMEIMGQWPAVADLIHAEKRHLGDAIDSGNLAHAKLVDFDGLQALLLAVEGKWDLLAFNPNNSKQYALEQWVDQGMLIRYEAGLPNPDWFYDKLYGPTEAQVAEHAHSNGNMPEPQYENLDDLGPAPDFFDLLGPDNA